MSSTAQVHGIEGLNEHQINVFQGADNNRQRFDLNFMLALKPKVINAIESMHRMDDLYSLYVDYLKDFEDKDSIDYKQRCINLADIMLWTSMNEAKLILQSCSLAELCISYPESVFENELENSLSLKKEEAEKLQLLINNIDYAGPICMLISRNSPKKWEIFRTLLVKEGVLNKKIPNISTFFDKLNEPENKLMNN